MSTRFRHGAAAEARGKSCIRDLADGAIERLFTFAADDQRN
jgi:hypothetical protein